MRTQNRPFRLATALAVTSLLIAQAKSQPVLAQGAPPPPAGAPDQQAGDPPERVGRLARINGAVSFRTQDENQWNPASLNYPVTAGNAFWTEPAAQAEIEVSASRFVMAPGTELDIATMTETDFRAIEPQGEIYVRLRPAAPDENYSVQTPRGLVSFSVPGRYAVVAGDTQSPTLVTVVEGAAHISGPGVELDIGPNQTAMLTGSDTFQGEVGPAQRDPFLTAMLDRERPPPQPMIAPPPAVAAMPGGEDLAQYGSWQDSPEYGQVWYPQVAPDWVPYRDGNWAYVAPWGWTWVDSAPWGFAPFHYGRWARVHDRWGWIPGRPVGPHPRPVYAPALVTFLGVAAVAGVGVGAVLAAGRIGWVPLGPREPFHPWYRSSDRYFRQVNVTHVTNVTTINRNVTINNFANRGAATVVPTSAMIGSRPVGRSFERVDPTVLSHARPVIGQQPLRPAPTTAGVTPAVARQLNLPTPTPGARPPAPGPSIHPMPAATTPGFTGGHAGRPPPLHDPAQPIVPPAASARPTTGAPALTTPGSRPQVMTPGARPGAMPTPSALTTPGGPPPGTMGTAHPPTPAVVTPGATPPLRTPGATGPFGRPPSHGQAGTAIPGAAGHPPPGALGSGQPPPTTVGTPALPPPGNTGPSGQPADRFQPTTAGPRAVPQSPPGAVSARPPVSGQPGTPMSSPFHASPPAGAPMPQVHTPPPAAVQSSAPFRPAPSVTAPQVYTPSPGAIRPATPPPAMHAPPPQAIAPQMRAPPPQVHTPPPQVMRPPPTPTPTPVARPAAPPPPPVAHAPPPQPQVRSAPPPSNNPHKRPGEP